MESITEHLRTRLEGGETPRELINKGYKRSTVYSVAQKMKGKLEKDSDDQSLERDVYLACIVKEVMGQLMGDMNFDTAKESERWASIIKLAGEHFEQVVGREPPKDFLTASLTLPE